LIKPPLFIAIFLSTKVGVVLKRFKSAFANSRCFLGLHFMFSSTGFGVNNHITATNAIEVARSSSVRNQPKQFKSLISKLLI
jgi:hypothetical protein